MPVQWSADSALPAFRLIGDFAIASIIPSPDSAGLAPFFPFGSIDAVTLGTLDGSVLARMPLHELTAADVLIASADDGVNVAEVGTQFAPGKNVVSARLDPSRPLPGPPVAWTGIDVLVLTWQQLQALSAKDVSTLLAGGTTIAVKLDPSQSAPLPWPVERGFYVMTCPSSPLTPQEVADADELYSSWRPGLTHVTRHVGWLLSLTIGLVLIGVSLWRSRWMLPTFVAAVAVSLIVLGVWQSSQPIIACASGDVIHHGASVQRTDRWIIEQSDRPAESVIPFDGVPIPGAENPTQADNLSIECAANGDPVSLRWKFPASNHGLNMAAIERIDPAGAKTIRSGLHATESPLSPLASSIYHRPLLSIGEASNEPRRFSPNQIPVLWPAIVIEDAKP